MIAITGATGQLGRLTLGSLLAAGVPAASIAALGRDPAKAAPLAARGLGVRTADYDQPHTIEAALDGVEKLLLISSNEIGRRFTQHRNVIDAARHRRVQLVIYTSLLHADTSPLSLASEHRETERFLEASGLPFVVLRNGWYTENYTASIPAALRLGAFYGSAGEGRIASAARADFAAAAAMALTGAVAPGRAHELAGGPANTLGELAAELSRQTGMAIPYRDLPEADYRAALLNAGLPGTLAAGLANWDVGAAQGGLFDDSRQLSRLIGRPTTTLAESVRQAIAAKS